MLSLKNCIEQLNKHDLCWLTRICRWYHSLGGVDRSVYIEYMPMYLHTSSIPTEKSYLAAAKLINSADALLITAGAGLGVDSGLPDFRGEHGFYNAYPQFKALGFSQWHVSNPALFIKQPRLAWGFYAHRYHLYKKTIPHAGYDILRDWLTEKDGFVFTSNVDGHFIKAGCVKTRLVECHGSIHYIQCLKNCNDHVRYISDLPITTDSDSLLANGVLPTCPYCGFLARPNILMFNDSTWCDVRYAQQASLYEAWLNRNRGKVIVVIEIGAGVTIPRVRNQFKNRHMKLIRINPHDCTIPYGGVAIKERAIIALQEINKFLDAPSLLTT